MALKMEIKVTKRTKRYYAEIWDGNILLGTASQSNSILTAKQAGAARLAQFKKEYARKKAKPREYYGMTYRRPLDYDNKCYRIDPVTGERTVI